MFQNKIQLIKKNWFALSILLIIFIAAFLRFYNYENRFGFAVDQAHYSLVARYALESHKLPLLGPFSSAGPFQTGGEWYWFIMLGMLLVPNSVIGPWVLITLIYILFVYLIIRFGTELHDKKFGIIAGLLTAFSTAQISWGTNLVNQSPIAILSLLSLWSAIRYIKLREGKYLFFLSFCISLASSIHLQGVSLVILIITTFIFTRFHKVKEILLLILGAVIPVSPIIISDLNHNFFNIKNMIYYYLHDQYNIPLEALGRRWKTYIGIFWPESWASVIGGFNILGYFFFFGSGLFFLYEFIKKKVSKEFIFIFLNFFIMFFWLRYVRTPIFDNYLIFLHPFILIITSWFITKIIEKKQILGILILSITIIASLYKDGSELNKSYNGSAFRSTLWSNKLIKKYPGKKFAVYDFQFKSRDDSLPLTLYLNVAGKVDDNGMKIGFVHATSGAQFKEPVIYKEKDVNLRYLILDLRSYDSKKLTEEGWLLVNPSSIYRSTEEWWK